MSGAASMNIIARIRSDFPEKFGIPRQSGLVNSLSARIIFEEEYRSTDAIRGLDGYSHIWLLWQFSEAMQDNWRPTVRPPRLGGNTRMGVFATRSPFRPNPIGLSCVKLDKIEISSDYGPILHISGADLLDGSPIFDIKPYLPYTDSHPDAKSGFALTDDSRRLEIDFPQELLSRVPQNKRDALIGVLSEDPRPGYQSEPERLYKLSFAGLDIHFTIKDSTLIVRDIIGM